MSFGNKFISIQLACRLRELNQGTLNVGNPAQRVKNLTALAMANALSTQTFAKFRANHSPTAVNLLILPQKVPGFRKPGP